MPRPAHYSNAMRVDYIEKSSNRTYGEKDETNDPDPYGHTTCAALGLAEPGAFFIKEKGDIDVVSVGYESMRATLPLLLRLGFSALFSGDHAEAPPKVVALLATARKQLLFRIPTHYGLGSPFDVTRFGGPRWSRKDGTYGSHCWW